MAYNEKIAHTNECTYFEGEVPVSWRYTFGVAGEQFYQAIKEKGQILSAYCPKCKIRFVPPKIYCERCFSALEKPEPIEELVGEIFSYTISYVKIKGERNEEGRPLVFVKFPGCEGGIIIEFNGKKEDIKIGAKVQVKFKPKAQRIGSPNDMFAVIA